MTHYCHVCHHSAYLPDAVHCAWCLEFWTVNHRWPTKDDVPKPTNSLARIYAAMGWEYPS